MKIADVRCFKVGRGRALADRGAADRHARHLSRVRQPHRHLPLGPSRSAGAKAEAVYVEVESDEGHVGLFGPIFPETAS